MWTLDNSKNFRQVGDAEPDGDFIYNRTQIYRESNNMAMKIREYDSNYFIIVVSQYAWESYFSDELGRTLENCGAFLIKEFTYQASARFGNFTRITDFQTKDTIFKTKMFHPYAFIGIPGLPPGQAYEQLRSNQGIYIEKPDFMPYAHLKVRIRFDTLIGMYSFDIPQNQYHRQSKFIDSHNLTHF